ncbi:MAG: hypothetical protein ABJB74_08480 [Gemmatimonas sp.]
MRIHELLPTQRNEIFLQIKKSGLHPGAFEWYEVGSAFTNGILVPQLQYSDTKFVFRFDRHGDRPWSVYSPAETELTKLVRGDNWWHTEYAVSEWLSCLKREVEAPDLWRGIRDNKAMFGGNIGSKLVSEEVFTRDERLRIATSVGQIQSFAAKTLKKDRDRLAFIEDRLQYIVESSERLGRKDWMNLTIGVLTNIAVGAALAPDAAREFLQIAASALGWVFQGLPLLPTPLR